MIIKLPLKYRWKMFLPSYLRGLLFSLFVSSRKVRGEGKKCRKVYGMENRDMWCTACRWKKACQRFTDWVYSRQHFSQRATPSGTAAFRQRKRGRSIILHAFGFLQLKIATTPAPPPSAPLAHSSRGGNQMTAESPFTLPSRIPSTASPFPSFPVFGKPQCS